MNYGLYIICSIKFIVNEIRICGLCVIRWGVVLIVVEFWLFFMGKLRFNDILVEKNGLEIKYLKKDYILLIDVI